MLYQLSYLAKSKLVHYSKCAACVKWEYGEEQKNMRTCRSFS